jgi:hypothetical protein
MNYTITDIQDIRIPQIPRYLIVFMSITMIKTKNALFY